MRCFKCGSILRYYLHVYISIYIFRMMLNPMGYVGDLGNADGYKSFS